MALVGLDGRAVDGGAADPDVAARWLDDGIAPNGAAGRGFTKGSVHGFDLSFAAPKSVSLLRALTDDIGEKAMQAAHVRAVEAAMTYLHRHAGYTRVHNPLTGTKDLQRLPGLVGIAYQHETSRCGDPHLHTHVIVANRQARADGTLVSIDSKSLYHEAKAAGVVYQAVLRHELHAELRVEWGAVDPLTGMAEVAASPRTVSRRGRGAPPGCGTGRTTICWSSMVSRAHSSWPLRRKPPVRPSRNPNRGPSSKKTGAPMRAVSILTAPHILKRVPRAARPRGCGCVRGWRRMVAQIDKAAFTRADLVELVGALLPVDAPGDPRDLIEQLVDALGIRVSAPRQAHHREGHELFTVEAVIAEEHRIFDMVDATDTRARLDVRTADLEGLAADQARAIATIAASPYLVQPLQAPAGAGKTHSLQALRAAAHRTNKHVLVLAPTGKAVDEAMRGQAGDRGLTVAKALHLIDDEQLTLDRAHRDRCRRSLHGRHPRAATPPGGQHGCARQDGPGRRRLSVVAG